MEITPGMALASSSSGATLDRPPTKQCLFYSITFPAVSKSGAPIDQVQVRYTIVDMATVVGPSLSGGRSGKIAIPLNYDGYATPREGNSIYAGFGKGMFTIYYIEQRGRGQAYFCPDDKRFTVTGLWPNSAYISVEVAYGSDQSERVAYTGPHLTASFGDGSPAPNPFVLGNPTVLAYYPSQPKCARQLKGSSVEVPPQHGEGGDGTLAAGRSERQLQQQPPQRQAEVPIGLLDANFAPGCKPTNTNVYRLVGVLSEKIGTDGGTGEACASNYLFSAAKPAGYAFAAMAKSTAPITASYSFEYGYIKMRVPRTFNNFRDLTFEGLKSPGNPGGYDANAFTISSNWMVPPSPNVPFSVNSLMLQKEGFNVKGVAFILFAPGHVVSELSNKSDTSPPTLYLPSLKVTAYLLAAPNYAFLFRYRAPSNFFKGSPGNAQCLESLADLPKAVATCEQLGDFLPQITRVSTAKSIQALLYSVK